LVAGDKELALSQLETNSPSNGNESHRQTLKLAVTPREHKEVEANAGASIPKSLKSLIQSVTWETERNAIAAALEKTGWNRKAAARLLGVSYRTMLYKIDQYHMSASEPYFSSFSETRLDDAGETKGNGKAS
jgi:DNA-binding NtrC family response regulator